LNHPLTLDLLHAQTGSIDPYLPQIQTRESLTRFSVEIRILSQKDLAHSAFAD